MILALTNWFVRGALHEKYVNEEDLSRKDAKGKALPRFLEVFFAPLRLCVRNIHARLGLMTRFS
jgi:hypothetical protein